MIFSGTVTRIVWSKPEDSFYILKIKMDAENAIESKVESVKGTIPGLTVQVGTWLGFEGTWVSDPKYGKQINIKRAPLFPSKIGASAVVSLLTDDVDRMILWRLRDIFGEDLSTAIEDVSRIRTALKVSEFEAEFLVNKWLDVKARYRAYNIVSSLKLTKNQTKAIWDTFGSDTERVVTESPYRLVEIPGISIQIMDHLAERFDIPKTCRERRAAVVLFCVREYLPQGDLYMSPKELLDRALTVSDLTEKQIVHALKEVLDNGSLILDKEVKEGQKAIFLPWAFAAEELAAMQLASRVSQPVSKVDWLALASVGGETDAVVQDPESTVDDIISMAIDECAEDLGLTLSIGQRSALFNALRYRVSVTTGLPGTGKSTSMRVLVEILQRSHTSTLLMAPTGIAAKRLGYVTSQPAYTVHRALGAQGVSGDDEREVVYAGVVGATKSRRVASLYGPQSAWEHHEGNPHPSRFVVVDESSMIDQDLVARILSGCHMDAHIVFVGDAAQLPSVGPGNVLRSIISSGVVPTTSLVQIFRQEDTSDIVTAAHAIYKGDVPDTSLHSDFALISKQNQSEVVRVILELVRRFYDRAANWEDSRQPPTFQVLSPRHSGDVGVTNLNSLIRDIVNPPRKGVTEMKLRTGVIRTGDRVMVTCNDYQKVVYNGDIGKVLSIDFSAKRVRVKIHGDARVVDFTVGEAMRSLRLAYACTVHKYQGLEVDAVIMPLINGFGRQLQRNLLYTAITRAKKKVILVGCRDALAKAVMNDKEDSRKTLFSERIQFCMENYGEQRGTEEEAERDEKSDEGD